jgi:hypothetical protein
MVSAMKARTSRRSASCSAEYPKSIAFHLPRLLADAADLVPGRIDQRRSLSIRRDITARNLSTRPPPIILPCEVMFMACPRHAALSRRRGHSRIRPS